MVKRKGQAKGKGKGYKNLPNFPKDPKVHSDSSKGRKQPQKLSPRVNAMLKKNPKLIDKNFKQLQKSGIFLKYQADSDRDGVPNIKDCKPLDVTRHKDMPVSEIEFDPSAEDTEKKESFISKTGRATGRFIKKEAIKGKTLLEKRKEEKEKQRIRELKEIDHPLVLDLERQKDRVDEIKVQIAETQDEKKEERLFDELEKEQNQLREVQEKITGLRIVDLSDEHLKTLAIRWKDDSIFGIGNNPYTEELKRRIQAEKQIENELDKERKKPAEIGGFFGL